MRPKGSPNEAKRRFPEATRKFPEATRVTRVSRVPYLDDQGTQGTLPWVHPYLAGPRSSAAVH